MTRFFGCTAIMIVTLAGATLGQIRGGWADTELSSAQMATAFGGFHSLPNPQPNPVPVVGCCVNIAACVARATKCRDGSDTTEKICLGGAQQVEDKDFRKQCGTPAKVPKKASCTSYSSDTATPPVPFYCMIANQCTWYPRSGICDATKVAKPAANVAGTSCSSNCR